MSTATVPPEDPPRRAFARAFVDQARARPGNDRAGTHPAAVGAVAVLSVLLVLLVGVVWGVIRPRPAGSGAAAPPATGSGLAAVAGWDCAGTERAGFQVSGRDGRWYTVPTGGWAGDGCHGTFESVPLSGDAGRDDTGVAALWWFRPDPTLGSCEILVYLPVGPRAGDAAASSASYQVLAGRSGTAYATFVVNQTDRPGRWHSAGSFPLNGEELAVRLGNRGVPGYPGAMLALAQLKVSCSP